MKYQIILCVALAAVQALEMEEANVLSRFEKKLPLGPHAITDACPNLGYQASTSLSACLEFVCEKKGNAANYKPGNCIARKCTNKVIVGRWSDNYEVHAVREARVAFTGTCIDGFEEKLPTDENVITDACTNLQNMAPGNNIIACLEKVCELGGNGLNFHPSGGCTARACSGDLEVTQYAHQFAVYGAVAKNVHWDNACIGDFELKMPEGPHAITDQCTNIGSKAAGTPVQCMKKACDLGGDSFNYSPQYSCVVRNCHGTLHVSPYSYEYAIYGKTGVN